MARTSTDNNRPHAGVLSLSVPSPGALPTWADGYINDAKNARWVPQLGKQVVRYLRHGVTPDECVHGRRKGVRGGPRDLPRNMDPYGWIDVVALSWAVECSVGECQRCLLSDHSRFAVKIRSTTTVPGGHFFTRAHRKHSLDIIPDHRPVEAAGLPSDFIDTGRTARGKHHRDRDHHKRKARHDHH